MGDGISLRWAGGVGRAGETAGWGGGEEEGTGRAGKGRETGERERERRGGGLRMELVPLPASCTARAFLFFCIQQSSPLPAKSGVSHTNTLHSKEAGGRGLGPHQLEWGEGGREASVGWRGSGGVEIWMRRVWGKVRASRGGGEVRGSLA